MPTNATVTVFSTATGALLRVDPFDSYTLAAGEDCIITPLGVSRPAWDWNAATHGYVENLDALRTRLIAEVKAASEQRKMLELSPGGAKKTEYPEKRAEVMKWDGLAASVVQSVLQAAFLALSTDLRQERFPYLMGEMLETGESAATVISRFRLGGRGSTLALGRIAGREQRACRAIRAALSPAAARAAAVVDWT